MPAKPKLNDRQRRFAEFVVSGHPAKVAYEKAGYQGGKNAEANAYRMMENEGVTAYMDELRKPQKEKALATRQKKREILYRIMTKGERDSDRIRAVMVDNLMTGDNQPIKVEGEITLKRVLDAIDASPALRD